MLLSTGVSWRYKKFKSKRQTATTFTFIALVNYASFKAPTRLAPFLHEIIFCFGLTYVKGGAILWHNKHVLSMKTKCQVSL